MVKAVVLFIMLLFVSPQPSSAKQTCQLPCKLQSTEWDVQVKELIPVSSAASSLWFRVVNTSTHKNNITINAFISSPIITLQTPLFNTVNISELSTNKDFVFQHYYKPTNATQLEILLTWKEYNKSYSDSFLVDLE
jgi:hypothetical protein